MPDEDGPRLPQLRHIRIFEPGDVMSLLRFEIKQAGSQQAWAEKTGVDRPRLNSALNGRKPITPSIIRGLGLRIAIVSDDQPTKKRGPKRG
jgi:hypothetical protein